MLYEEHLADYEGDEAAGVQMGLQSRRRRRAVVELRYQVAQDDRLCYPTVISIFFALDTREYNCIYGANGRLLVPDEHVQ